MITWFSDEKKNKIRPELLDKEAHEEARKWARSKDRRDNPVFTVSQLRRYFGEVKNLERQMMVLKDEGWDTVFPMVKMLKSKVTYDMRKDNKIPREFKDYIYNCVDSIKGKEDFKAFLKYFEASVGFFYGEGKGRV